MSSKQYWKNQLPVVLIHLLGMLALLAADRSAPRQVSLQVSGLNGAARSLYKKTGFRDAEALSYYLY